MNHFESIFESFGFNDSRFMFHWRNEKSETDGQSSSLLRLLAASRDINSEFAIRVWEFPLMLPTRFLNRQRGPRNILQHFLQHPGDVAPLFPSAHRPSATSSGSSDR